MGEVTRLLLVVDSHRWAWGHMAQGIKKYAPAPYRVSVVDQTEFGTFTNHHDLFEPYHAVCQFPFGEATTKIPIRSVSVVAAHGWCEEWPHPEDATLRQQASSGLRNVETLRTRGECFDAIIATNRRLEGLVNSLHADKGVYCQSGVDTTVFFQRDCVRTDGKLRIGWCSQPQSVCKGYPVLKALMRRFPTVGWIVNDRTAKDPLTPKEMSRWYSGIDLLLCTSVCEGGPLPPIEAAACGRACLSTAVGHMPDFVVQNRTGVLVPEYADEAGAQECVEQLAAEIQQFIDDRPLLYRMGQMALKHVQSNFGWNKLAAQWCEAIAGC